MELFDYIYYRWLKVYAKEDRDPDIYASGIVSAYQLLTIVNLVSFGCILLGIERPEVKYIIPVIVLIFIFNYFRYERGFDISKLEEKWGNEPEDRKRIRFILLVAYLVVTFTVPWIYGFATN
ncbi:hypothetical protein C900_05873 [Fulvivirga imtechensis AK7]|uniref:Uncharacterized protein n=2 Tax=Fulvivirga TaxID=396811 RepID=L8JIQ8_9BACT|nr:hypothetical protein C900_05873 [Fulvivirga imtechensis AK7]